MPRGLVPPPHHHHSTTTSAGVCEGAAGAAAHAAYGSGAGGLPQPPHCESAQLCEGGPGLGSEGWGWGLAPCRPGVGTGSRSNGWRANGRGQWGSGTDAAYSGCLCQGGLGHTTAGQVQATAAAAACPRVPLARRVRVPRPLHITVSPAQPPPLP